MVCPVSLKPTQIRNSIMSYLQLIICYATWLVGLSYPSRHGSRFWISGLLEQVSCVCIGKDVVVIVIGYARKGAPK